LTYSQPIGSLGTILSVSASQTDTDPGFDLSQFEVRGHSSLYSAKVTHPFIRSRNENLNGSLTFDWRDVKSSNNLEATRKDRIRALRAALNYEFVDTLFGAGVNGFGVEVSKGLKVFSASSPNLLNLTRPNGDPTFTKIEANLQRLQRVTNSVNLLMAASGQLANAPLLSSEEFSVGGVNTVRGFDPSEISGDDGVAGKIEFQWNNPGNHQRGYVDKYQLYTFFDAGHVWDQDATTSNQKRETLTGAGGGLRVNFVSDLTAGFGIAFPLNRDVQTQRDKDPKVYFNLSKQF
jgi:hemolysin activation/secretion protein